MTELSIVAVPGIGAVVAGDDLASLVVDAMAAAGLALHDDDVVVVASKVVAKAEGRTVPARDRERALDAESVAEVAARTLPDGRRTRVVRTRTGPVLAAAGIDSSDVPDGTVLLLPADPDASARAFRARLHELTGLRLAVVVTDTSGRPWREGVSDFALGAAGFAVLDDARGRLDAAGRPLEVTVRSVADEVAAAADLVKGKVAGTPVAIVRGLGASVTTDDGPGAAVLVRGPHADWFRHGHVEAVWRALGSAHVDPPAIDPSAQGLGHRVRRAVQVALEGSAGAVELDPAGSEPVGAAVTVRIEAPDAFVLGGVVERLRAAAWAEDLVLAEQHLPGLDPAQRRAQVRVVLAPAPSPG